MHPNLRVMEVYCIHLFYSNICRFHVGKVTKIINTNPLVFCRLKAEELNEIWYSDQVLRGLAMCFIIGYLKMSGFNKKGCKLEECFITKLMSVVPILFSYSQ
jgi:hypothetical protein